MSTSTVHVAVFDTFADWEVGYATAHIRSRNWQREPGRYSITTVGPTREPVTTMAGFRAAARRFLAAGVPVAAICGATFGLALEGLLDDRAHTSNAAEYLALSGYAGGDRFVAEPAVVDGDLITASGVAPVHFARAIFERLAVYTAGVATSWFKLYGDRDPAGFYELMAVPAGGPA